MVQENKQKVEEQKVCGNCKWWMRYSLDAMVGECYLNPPVFQHSAREWNGPGTMVDRPQCSGWRAKA